MLAGFGVLPFVPNLAFTQNLCTVALQHNLSRVPNSTSLLFFPIPTLVLDLEQLTEAAPTWLARLSLPLSTDYKDNVVSPGALHFPASQEATIRDEPHTFATFGKAPGGEPSTTQPRLASSFISEMSTLFEMILAQKASPQMDASSGLLRQLSIHSRTIELDEDARRGYSQ